MSELDNVRFELSFSDPNTVVPTWNDMTLRTIMRAGIEITRGRTDELVTAPPGTCGLTMKNEDGYLTPGLGAGPYNVRGMNRGRVTYRDPLVSGNILDAESAAFEGGTVGGWTGTSGAAVGNSAARAFSGSRSLLITWPTQAAANASSGRWATDSVLVVGRSYTAWARVWVGSGPSVRLAFINNTVPFYGTGTTGTGAWEWISTTFTPTKPECVIVLRANGATTSGQQVWVDEVRIDETNSPTTFSTTPLNGTGGVIVGRYDGYVEDWPVAWPSGGQTQSEVTVRMFDLKGRINRAATLRSVIEETYALNSPTSHMPLNEDDDNTTTVGDRTGSEATLSVTDVGSGLPAATDDAAVIFGGGTGPSTDGGRAVRFAPASSTNGQILSGSINRQGTGFGTTGYTYTASFRTATIAAATVARWADPYGSYIELGISATGKATVTFYDSWSGGISSTYTSVSTFANNATHAAHITVEFVGRDITVNLYINGVLLGGFTMTVWVFLPDLGAGALTVGGAPADRLFTGTVSHVAAFATPLDAATILEHAKAVRNGFNNERTNERLTRIASWVGIDPAFLNFDTGSARVGHVDCTGVNAGDYMDLVTTTEAGNLFTGTDGRLTFHNRARAYAVAAAIDINLPSETIDPGVQPVLSVTGTVNDVTVSRNGGATVHLVDAVSRDANGEASTSLTVASSTDADALARAQWILATRATPIPRLPELGMDALTEPTSSPAVRTCDINERVALNGLPSQWPPSITDLRVQGYRETINTDGWDIVANTTPYLVVRPLIADDPVYGVADADNRAVY